MRSAIAIGLVAFGLVAQAQLTVTTKQAVSVITTESVQVTQVSLDDGSPLGSPVLKEMPAVVSPKQPVGLIFVKHTKPVAELLIKIKCKTADVQTIEPGVYAITKAGTHDCEINVISQNPLAWDDENIRIVVGHGPNPPPGPEPTPTPTPGVLPIDGDGLRVLVVYESADLSKLPRTQWEAMHGAELRNWLNANCVAGPDGAKEWRALDADTKYTDPNNVWAKALAKPRTGLPWIAISNGTTGYAGPFPMTTAETIALLEQFKTPVQRSSSKAKPILEVYSTTNCPQCDRWKSEVLPQAMMRFDVRFISPPPHYVNSFPTFVLRVPDGSATLVGFQTMDQLDDQMTYLSMGGESR
jgi:hypothetical protein